MISRGNRQIAARPRGMSVTNMKTADRTTITTTPDANGIGASTAVEASASTPARVIRSPVLCRRCQGTGCTTRRSMTSALIVSVARHTVRPAHVRLTTTPAARRKPMAIRPPRTAATLPADTEPCSNRCPIRSSVIRPTITADATVQAAKTADPATAMKKVPLWWWRRARTSRNACTIRPRFCGTSIPSPMTKVLPLDM